MDTILLTGATGGLGEQVALLLAADGHRVLATARDARRGERLVEQVRKATGGAIELLVADLASLKSVRALADEVARRAPRLRALVNNAAIVPRTAESSADGIELQFAVNHLAHYLLTRLLRPQLRAGAPSRVVTVSSQLHRDGVVDLERVRTPGAAYLPLRAYNRSKLANLLFTRALAERFAGDGVTAYALHPGVFATNVLDDLEGRSRLMRFRIRRHYADPVVGARRIVRLATADVGGAPSGSYFHEDRLQEPAPQARDDAMVERLWIESARLCGIEP